MAFWAIFRDLGHYFTYFGGLGRLKIHGRFKQTRNLLRTDFNCRCWVYKRGFLLLSLGKLQRPHPNSSDLVVHMSSILFGDTMAPIIEQDSILLWGYSILYKEYNLTRFNHQKRHYSYERGITNLASFHPG